MLAGVVGFGERPDRLSSVSTNALDGRAHNIGQGGGVADSIFVLGGRFFSSCVVQCFALLFCPKTLPSIAFLRRARRNVRFGKDENGPVMERRTTWRTGHEADPGDVRIFVSPKHVWV